MAIKPFVRLVFTTRNTTYVVVQGDTGQYFGRFNTEAVSLYTAESGVATPEIGQQATLHYLDHHGRYDRMVTSRVKDVVLHTLSAGGTAAVRLTDVTAFMAVSWEVQQVLSFAERCEAQTVAKYAEIRRLAPAL